MTRRNLLALIAASAWLGAAFLATNAMAQQGDLEEVHAASKAFYAALPALDGGAAMEKVWAHTPYVTYVAPRSKTITVGWDALKKMWQETDTLFSKRTVVLGKSYLHANGNVAWEMGNETGQVKMKNGTTTKVDVIVTTFTRSNQTDGGS
jgi:ketosteroid isomerase-like protein